MSLALLVGSSSFYIDAIVYKYIYFIAGDKVSIFSVASKVDQCSA